MLTYQYADINDLKVHYHVSGEGDPLILMHGGGTRSNTGEEMIPILAKEFKVYTYDQRGTGKTVKPPNPPLSYDLWADDLVRFMDHFDLKKIILAGWSRGGAISLNFMMHHPERVSHLILIGAGSPLRPASDRSGFMERIKLAQAGLSADEIVEQTFWFSKSAFSPYTIEHNPAALEKLKIDLKDQDPATYAEGLSLGRLAIEDKLGNIQCPTLVLVGDADARTPVEMSEDLNKAIPNSYMKIIPNCGHFYGYEQPALTSQAMINFLKAFS